LHKSDMERSFEVGSSDKVEYSLLEKIPVCFRNLQTGDVVSIVAIQQNGFEVSFCAKCRHTKQLLPYKVSRNSQSNYSITFFCKGALCSSKHPGQVKVVASVKTKESFIVELQSHNILLRVRRTKNDDLVRRKKRYSESDRNLPGSDQDTLGKVSLGSAIPSGELCPSLDIVNFLWSTKSI